MSEEQFARRTRAYRTKLIWWLIGTFIIANVTFGVKEWVNPRRGWEADVVYFVFFSVFILSAFGVMMFGALLYGWFKEIEPAKRDREDFDSKVLVQIRRSVFGPIPWR